MAKPQLKLEAGSNSVKITWITEEKAELVFEFKDLPGYVELETEEMTFLFFRHSLKYDATVKMQQDNMQDVWKEVKKEFHKQKR